MPTIYLHQTCVASIIKHNYHFLCTDNFPRDDSIISCFFFRLMHVIFLLIRSFTIVLASCEFCRHDFLPFAPYLYHELATFITRYVYDPITLL